MSLECWALEKIKANSPVMTLVKTKHRPQPEHKETPKMLPVEEHPFISEGYVSLTENDKQFPVKILRDTGASQFLILGSVLPLSEQTSLAANVLVQGVG